MSALNSTVKTHWNHDLKTGFGAYVMVLRWNIPYWSSEHLSFFVIFLNKEQKNNYLMKVNKQKWNVHLCLMFWILQQYTNFTTNKIVEYVLLFNAIVRYSNNGPVQPPRRPYSYVHLNTSFQKMWVFVSASLRICKQQVFRVYSFHRNTRKTGQNNFKIHLN